MLQLGRQVSAESMKSRPDVPLKLPRPQNLGHGTGRLTAPDLELKQSVTGGGIALRKEQVRLVVRVDVIDAPAVGDDLDRRRQTGGPQRLLLSPDHGAVARGQARQANGHRDNELGAAQHGWGPLCSRLSRWSVSGRIIIPALSIHGSWRQFRQTRRPAPTSAHSDDGDI